MDRSPLPELDASSPLDASFRFGLLGELRIMCNGEPVPLPLYRTHSLLAALLLHPRPQRRERLIGMLFPDVPERVGRRRLSDRLWLLRRSLPWLPLEADAQEILFPPETRWLDVEAFWRAAGGERLQDWLEALALYRGDLLESVYDDWLLAEREALYLEYVRLSHRACAELLYRRQFDEALPLAERLVQSEPYDEKALRVLMKAYRGVGRRGAALAAYENFVALAADELGLEPESATRALAQAIRSAGFCARVAPTSIPDASSSAALLAYAYKSLAQGDRAAVEDSLRLLRTRPTCRPDDIRLLEVDLALFFEEYERASRLLTTCDPRQTATLVRVAQLALAQHETAVAHTAASQALIMANEAGDRESELESLLTLAEAQRKLGQTVQAARSERQALDLAWSCASPLGAARALVLKGYRQIRQGRYAEALAPLHEALSLAHEHGFRRTLARALRGIGMVQSYTYRLLDAMKTLQEELTIWRDLGLSGQEVSTLHNLSVVQAQLGRTTDCLRTLEQARQLCEQLGSPVRVAINEYHLANTLLAYDDATAPRAVDVILEALTVFRSHEQPGWEAAALTTLGLAMWLGGQHVQALDAFRKAYVLYERLGELGFLPELLAYQGLACLGMGDKVDSLHLTRMALASLAQGEVSDEAISDVHYARAMALAASGEEARAEAHLDRAYKTLLAGAAQLEDEPARRAFFHRSPITRRLMQEVYARGIAPAPESGTITRLAPAARGGRPVRIRWTVDAGPSDAALKQARGAVALRRARLSRLLREAQAQGAVPTVAHLAEALGVSRRTIQRDLAALRG